MAISEAHVLLPTEAELLVQSIQLSEFESIGSKKWWSQHEVIEKLNIQSIETTIRNIKNGQAAVYTRGWWLSKAVLNASSNTDEYVKDFLVSHNKIKVLIYDLIISELWTEKVFPFIKVNIDKNRSSLPVYMAIFHETSTCGLLETVLYYKECCESAGDEIIDLIDYVNRKLTTLLLLRDEERGKPESKNSEEDLTDQHKAIQFSIYMKCISILRYLSDAFDELPLSAITRILNTHDFPCLLVQILDASPWRRTVQGKQQIFNDNKWCHVGKDEYRLLAKLEGQVWLTIYQLLLHREAQQKYEYTSYRKTQVLKLRRYLNEVLLDQLPHLVDLQRFLENLSVVEPPPARSELVIEQIPEIRAKLEQRFNNKWMEIAVKQLKKYFTIDDTEMKEHAQRLASTYNLDVLETLLGDPPSCAFCQGEAMKRCSRCQNEWYCSRPCQVKHWSKHKDLCNMLAQPKS